MRDERPQPDTDRERLRGDERLRAECRIVRDADVIGFQRPRPQRGMQFADADLAAERRAERILDLRPEPIRVDQGQRHGAEDQHAEHDRGRADEQTFHANLPSPIRDTGCAAIPAGCRAPDGEPDTFAVD